MLRLSTDELVRLAPRLRPYLTTPTPTWPEIVDAADWLRGDLGVSKSLWGEACLAMGREQAAIAIAIVSAKPAEHFRSTPGGYFHGMVAKAKAGELNLGADDLGLAPGGRIETTPRAGQGRGPASVTAILELIHASAGATRHDCRTLGWRGKRQLSCHCYHQTRFLTQCRGRRRKPGAAPAAGFLVDGSSPGASLGLFLREAAALIAVLRFPLLRPD